MRETWFHVSDLHAGELTLDPGQARHAVQSLRLKAGDSLTLFDGEGRIAAGTLRPPDEGNRSSGRRKPAVARVQVSDVRQVPAPTRSLSLVVAACKGPRLDWFVEKITELGVTRLILADFDHSVVRVGPQHLDRLNRVALEACKQCRRPWRPRLALAPTPLDAAATRGEATLFVAHRQDGIPPLGAWLAQHGQAATDCVAVVGPEGGLSPDEIDALRHAGGQLVRLGEHVLRVETAALAVAAAWATCADA